MWKKNNRKSVIKVSACQIKWALLRMELRNLERDRNTSNMYPNLPIFPPEKDKHKFALITVGLFFLNYMEHPLLM